MRSRVSHHAHASVPTHHVSDPHADSPELTFIICARTPDAHDAGATARTLGSLTMIGDVNLFFKGSPEDDDDEFEVEVEIMIAGAYPPAASRARVKGR